MVQIKTVVDQYINSDHDCVPRQDLELKDIIFDRLWSQKLLWKILRLLILLQSQLIIDCQ